MANLIAICKKRTLFDGILSFIVDKFVSDLTIAALKCTSKDLLLIVKHSQHRKCQTAVGEDFLDIIPNVVSCFLDIGSAVPDDFHVVHQLLLPNKGTVPRDPVALSEAQKHQLFDCLPQVVHINSTIGWGVLSGRVIPRDSLLFPYYGDFISTQEANRRHATNAQNRVMNYILTIREHVPASDSSSGGVLVSNIDASRFGSIARFVNHSCEPSACVVMLRKLGDVVGVPVLKSLRTIAPGEQITFNYGGSEVPTAQQTHSTNTVLGKRPADSDSGRSDGNGDGSRGEGSSGGIGADVSVEAQRKKCFCNAARCSGYLPSSV